MPISASLNDKYLSIYHLNIRMGAEESSIKSYHVDPPYDIGTTYVSDDGQRKSEVVPYVVHPAKHKVNGSKVSIFIYNKSLEPKIGPSCAEV